MLVQILSSLAAIFFFMIFLNNFMMQKWQKLPPTPFGLPITGHLHLLEPLVHHTFHKLSSKYGPLIYLRLGSVPCVVASTPELAKQFLKTHELNFSARRSSFAVDELTYYSSFAFSPFGPYWKFIKKISTMEFLGSRMQNRFRPIRKNELHTFLRNFYLKSKNGEWVNVTEELMNLSNNIISLMTLSMRSSDSDGDAEIARSVIRRVTQIFGEFNVSDIVWFCKNVDLQGLKKKVFSIKKDYDGLIEKLITKREEMRLKNKINKNEYEAKDFLDILLDAMEDQNAEIQLTRNHIKALFLDIFTAGTETTATTLDWAVAELINNPTVLQQARQEINKVVGNNRIVDDSDISNLIYIQAILKETFRLHPPVPMISRKSNEDCTINGYKIPKNSMLFINMWSVGRDPKNWETPLKFEPERFIIDENNGNLIDVKGHHFELLPFGSGRRSCPAISFAMQHLPTTLAAMIQCFDFRVKDGVVDMTERPGLTTPRVHDLVCEPVALAPQLLDPLISL